MKFALQSVIIIFMLAITAIPLHADKMHQRGIQLDGTIGNAGKLDLPGPDYDIRAEYGQQVGTNLFHSFQQFNIHKDESATFSGSDSVQNIISRVTGGDSSWIDGKLSSTIPNADLFLLNPSGVMFGPDASLNLGGSFHVSTADYLRLGENERFYAIPHADDVLSFAAPAAFGFLDGDVAPISVEGKGELTTEVWGEEYDNWEDWLKANSEYPAGLAVPKGETLSLTGGDIEITKGAYAPYEDEYENPYTSVGANLSAPEGEIRIASVASPGAVETGSQASGFKFQVSKGGNMKISDKSVLDVSGSGGGSVFIRGGQFEMTDSKVLSYTKGDQDGGVIDIQTDNLSIQESEIGADTKGAGKGSDIVLKSADTLNVSNTFVYADSDGGGDAGNIETEAGQIILNNGTQVFSTAYSSGKSGDISVRVADTLTLSGSDTLISSDSGEDETSAEGNAGHIEIEARQITLTDGASVSSDTYGFGRGGDIVIKVADTLMISGLDEEGEGTVVSSDSGNDEISAEGNAGHIEIEARQITLTDGASVTSDTYGPGQAGTVVIKAEETLELSGGSMIFATSQEEVDINAGNAGRIEIEARQMTLKDKSQINVSTWGSGEGGTATVNVGDMLTLSEGSEYGDPGGIFANSEFEEGNGSSAGSIDINAGQITITDWLEISSTTKGHGRGGTITVNVDDTLKISASDTSSPSPPNCGIFAKSISTSAESGSGAGMDISARTILLSGKRAAISASTYGGGDAGDIRLTSDQLRLDNGASVFSASYGSSGDAGSITVNAADSVRLTGNSKLTTSTKAEGDAGDIRLTSDRLELDNDASVSSTSSYDENGGKAGTITVNATDSVRLTGNSKLTTEAESAGGGKIFVSAGNEVCVFGGEITSSVSQSGSEGNGGDIRIGDSAKPQFLILNQGDITANADKGDGGAIFIHTENFLKSSDSAVEAKSARGNDGTVRIDAPDTDISSDMTLLPDDFPDATRWMRTPCSARSGEDVSRFLMLGKGGLRAAPDHLMSSPPLWFDD